MRCGRKKTKKKTGMNEKVHAGLFLVYILLKCYAVSPLQHGFLQLVVYPVFAYEFADPVVISLLEHTVQIGVFGTGYRLCVAEIIVAVSLYQFIGRNTVQVADFLGIISKSGDFISLVFQIGCILGFDRECNIVTDDIGIKTVHLALFEIIGESDSHSTNGEILRISAAAA